MVDHIGLCLLVIAIIIYSSVLQMTFTDAGDMLTLLNDTASTLGLEKVPDTLDEYSRVMAAIAGGIGVYYLASGIRLLRLPVGVKSSAVGVKSPGSAEEMESRAMWFNVVSGFGRALLVAMVCAGVALDWLPSGWLLMAAVDFVSPLWSLWAFYVSKRTLKQPEIVMSGRSHYYFMLVIAIIGRFDYLAEWAESVTGRLGLDSFPPASPWLTFVGMILWPMTVYEAVCGKQDLLAARAITCALLSYGILVGNLSTCWWLVVAIETVMAASIVVIKPQPVTMALGKGKKKSA